MLFYIPFTISISNTGIGMNDDQLRTQFRLDRPFRREGTTDKQGSGSGQIVCREMLEKHGTTLHIESGEGKGSRFWFHGTQEEWWEHFHRIEEGPFYTIEEANEEFKIWKEKFLASRM